MPTEIVIQTKEMQPEDQLSQQILLCPCVGPWALLLTFRHRVSSILGQAFCYSPEVFHYLIFA